MICIGLDAAYSQSSSDNTAKAELNRIIQQKIKLRRKQTTGLNMRPGSVKNLTATAELGLKFDASLFVLFPPY